MTAVVLRVDLTEQPIELSEYEALVSHESAGAVVIAHHARESHDGSSGFVRHQRLVLRQLDRLLGQIDA